MAIGDNLYTVEINDSEFEREGWKRGRYKGTKLTATQINKFTEGDVTFGKEPVIEQYSKTIYVFNKANSSFESNAGVFYPTTDEFTQTLPDKTIIDTTNFKIDRAVTFNINDPSDFSQIEPGANENDPSFHLFDTQVKHDLALFNTCSVRFFDNTNNGFVKKQYIVGYNRGEFKPAAAFFQNAEEIDADTGIGTKISTNVTVVNNSTFFTYDLTSSSGKSSRLYINPNVEEWFISQEGASGSQGVLTAGQTAITIDNLGDQDQINSAHGYFFQLSKRLGKTSVQNERYYVSFNEGKKGGGNLVQKDLIKAFDIHALEDSGSNISISNKRFFIKITGRHNNRFKANYNQTGDSNTEGTEEYVIFKEFPANNVIHLDFNIDIEAPVGTGDGGVIIPANLHPVIKEQLNVYLSNAGLGAQGGTSGNFRTRGVLARSKKVAGGQQLLDVSGFAVSPTGGPGKSGTSGTSPDDEEDTSKPFNFNVPDSFFDSDIRLKENIIFLKKSLSGIPIYKFNYIGKSETYTGTMAQDLLRLGLNKAVSKNTNGYYVVDYSLIDVDMKKV